MAVENGDTTYRGKIFQENSSCLLQQQSCLIIVNLSLVQFRDGPKTWAPVAVLLITIMSKVSNSN